MWSYEKNAVVRASRAVVWQWWTNVEKWPTWDTDLSEAALLGELAVGAQGRMKVADDAVVPFVVTELIPDEKLVIAIALVGGALSYSYTMTEEENGDLKLAHGVSISGVLGFFWRMMLKKKVQRIVDAALTTLAAQVTEESARRAALEPAPVAPVADGEAPTAESASAEGPADNSSAKQANPEAGDPQENALRAQDMHTQIEAAARAEVTPEAAAAAAQALAPEQATEGPTAPAVPVEGEPSPDQEHTAVVPVSPVVTKKETKRPKKA